MRKVLVALPSSVTPATHVRGTLIVNSQMEARARGLENRYWRHVPDRYQPTLRELIASMWVPMPLAMVHYQAMNQLQLPRAEIIAIGGAAGDRLHRSFLGMIARTARATGAVDPCTLLRRLDRMYDRTIQGGGIGCVQVGPKDAIVEHVGLAIFQLPYVRAGFEGFYRAGFELLSRRAYVRQLPQAAPDEVRYELSWV